jgi:hypothetical protein
VNVTAEEPTYIKPDLVLAPKRSWQLFHVLYDGGPGGGENDRATGSSLAIGRWDGKPVLAMRWNGHKGSRLGNPQSRGLPTWFIVPDEHVRQILETQHYAFSHDKIKFARDFLELKRVYFLTRCPTLGCSNFGNLTLASYDVEKVVEYIEMHRRRELKFYCIYCDQQWLPTDEEHLRLTEVLKTGLSQYRKRGGQ